MSTPAGGSEDTFSNYSSGVLLEDDSSTEIAESICRSLEDVRWREEAALNASKMALEKFSLETMVEILRKYTIVLLKKITTYGLNRKGSSEC